MTFLSVMKRGKMNILLYLLVYLDSYRDDNRVSMTMFKIPGDHRKDSFFYNEIPIYDYRKNALFSKWNSSLQISSSDFSGDTIFYQIVLHYNYSVSNIISRDCTKLSHHKKYIIFIQ